MVEWPALGWVDLAMLGVVAFSALVGVWRGFTFELLSLAGWFFAYFAARWLQPWAATELPIGAARLALESRRGVRMCVHRRADRLELRGPGRSRR